jgi:hypothetical protein
MTSKAFERARVAAKTLLAELSDRKPEALSRVLASHPKFVGRPRERATGWHFTLADAQATVAVEQGHDSWAGLNLALNPRRSFSSGFSDIERRAFAEAQKLGHPHLLPDHFLLAVLKPGGSTATLETLSELGLTYEGVRDNTLRWNRRRRKADGAQSTIPSHSLVGFARGVAVGQGSPSVTDEHVLLAFVFQDQFQRHLSEQNIDPQDVLAQLAMRGVTLPDVDPPPLEAPFGPLGPWVYVPRKKLGDVTKRLSSSFPPGTLRWGTNQSKWKKDYWYVQGEDSIPMEDLVREVITDPTEVVVLAFEEGLEVEKEGAKRKYRDQP